MIRLLRRSMGAHLRANWLLFLLTLAGVALGVDRLLMVLLGEDRIGRVMPFDWTRC